MPGIPSRHHSDEECPTSFKVITVSVVVAVVSFLGWMIARTFESQRAWDVQRAAEEKAARYQFYSLPGHSWPLAMMIDTQTGRRYIYNQKGGPMTEMPPEPAEEK